MEWVLLVLAICGTGLLVLGYLTDRDAKSADERVGMVVPIIGGVILLAIAALIGIGWPLVEYLWRFWSH